MYLLWKIKDLYYNVTVGKNFDSNLNINKSVKGFYEKITLHFVCLFLSLGSIEKDISPFILSEDSLYVFV